MMMMMIVKLSSSIKVLTMAAATLKDIRLDRYIKKKRERERKRTRRRLPHPYDGCD
jgi:hypothetical protein